MISDSLVTFFMGRFAALLLQFTKTDTHEVSPGLVSHVLNLNSSCLTLVQ